MNTCIKRYENIPFAHRQPDHDGHCRFIHGHNWTFEFEFACDRPDECGFVLDFGKLKVLRDELESFDHALVLSKTDPLLEKEEFLREFCILRIVEDSSCEGLARGAWRLATMILRGDVDWKARGVRCLKVTVWEDSRNAATYIP